jgi:hypothetical protein
VKSEFPGKSRKNGEPGRNRTFKRLCYILREPASGVTMPFSFRVRLAEEDVGIPIVEPAVVTQRLLNESGVVERGTPVMRVRLGSIEYEFRTLFRCYIGVRVDAGQWLSTGVILAAGGADGEELPDGPQSFSAHQVDDQAKT